MTARPAPLPWHWRLQAMLADYLPLVLMAVLAGGSWWLVKNTPMFDGPSQQAVLRHVPDYRMTGFEIRRITPDGTLQVLISGRELRHYPDDDTVEIDDARVQAVAPDGTRALATARLARSNADGSHLQLEGDVRLRRFAPKATDDSPAQLDVHSAFLEVLSNAELMRSNRAVTIEQDGIRIQAQGFEYRHLTGQLRFFGRTEAVMATTRKR
jgi:lipopolysaccharide export system protein LptC